MTNNKAREIHDFIASRGGSVASTFEPLPEAETRITEMVNGVLVTRPVKKVTEIRSKEPEVIDLQEYAKSGSKGGSVSGFGSVQGINKMKEIVEFINSNRRRY